MFSEIFKLKELSAKLGNDLSLIQASGGNTSIKFDGKLLVKASGKKLKNALNEDIFVSLDLIKIFESKLKFYCYKFSYEDQ